MYTINMDPNQDTNPATVPTFDSPPTPTPEPVASEPRLTDPVMPETSPQTPSAEVTEARSPATAVAPPPEKPVIPSASRLPAGRQEGSLHSGRDDNSVIPDSIRNLPSPPTPPPTPRPAALPANVPSAIPFKLGLIIGVALIVIGSTAAAAFLYVQNKSLNSKLSAIQDTLKQRELTATPTPSSPVPSPEEDLNTTVTPASMSTKLNTILPFATKESPTAQLLMITNANILDAATPYKFWFRRAPNTRNYFVIEQIGSETPTLLTQANVTPDNNIPDLIKEHNDGTLGIDAGTALDIAKTTVLADYTTVSPTLVSVKFVRSGATNSAIKEMNIWQLVIKYPTDAKLADVVVQIDANTKDIVFTNVPEKPTK